jgi:hypothetical protein
VRQAHFQRVDVPGCDFHFYNTSLYLKKGKPPLF